MGDFANSVIDFARQNPDWIALIMFVLAFFEFLPLVWFVVVGVAAIVGPSEPVRLWLVVLAATLGGAAGDSFLYWLGRRYQGRIGSLWPFSRHPKLLIRSNAFFQRWGEGAVILGRFTGPVRAGAPVVAGTLKMPWLRFLIATLLGAFAWAVVFLWPSALGVDWLGRFFSGQS
jgi:membrane protein DedA with SNARE-associated domain